MSFQDRIKRWDDLAVGDTASFTKTITETDVVLWVGLAGDMNPIHIDREYSKTTRFGDVIAPGVLVMGLISTTVTMLTFGNVYASQNVRFRRPVYIGDTITATTTIVEKLEEKHMVRMETKCVNQKGETVIIGEGMQFILE